MSEESDFDTVVESCSKKDNGVSICLPETTDIWVNGTSHYFVWKYNNPFYVSADSLNMYLYYIINYAYVNVKTYSNLTTLTGGTQVTVDNSWFTQTSTSSQNLTMYGFLLPSTANVTEELSNPDSQYPRPFNFTVTQLASNAPSTSTTTTSTTTNDTTSTNSTDTTQKTSNSTHNSLPSWAIAVIVIASIAILCGAIALIWTTLISRRNKKNNKLTPVIIKTPKNSEKSEKVLVDNISMNSQAPILGCRSSESVIMRESSIASRPTLLTDSSAIEAFRSTAMYEEEEEMRRRRLGEALLQKQLEEDGTSVKHAGRFTHVKSLADIQKSAVVEQPQSSPTFHNQSNIQ